MFYYYTYTLLHQKLIPVIVILSIVVEYHLLNYFANFNCCVSQVKLCQISRSMVLFGYLAILPNSHYLFAKLQSPHCHVPHSQVTISTLLFRSLASFAKLPSPLYPVESPNELQTKFFWGYLILLLKVFFQLTKTSAPRNQIAPHCFGPQLALHRDIFINKYQVWRRKL